MGDATQISILQTVLDNEIYGWGHGTPGAVKKAGNLYPGQKPGPSGQVAGKGICKPTLSRGPGDLLNVNTTTVFAYHTAWWITQKNR